MLLKTSKSALPKFFLFNAAAAVMGVGTVTWIVRDAVVGRTEAPCSTRYTHAMPFALSRGTEPMTPADLQARLAGRDWGLLENTNVVRVSHGPSPLALDVRLPKDSGSQQGGPERTSGMGFQWKPQQMRSANSACLSFSIRLPKDFDFGPGGALPGLFGETHIGAERMDFSVRGRWREGGKTDLRVVGGGTGSATPIVIDGAGALLPRDTWVKIEQEVVLNGAGKPDGIVRVWIDDTLAYERTGLALRSADAGFAGVIADVHYSRGDLTWLPSPKPSSILLSPFELRWK